MKEWGGGGGREEKWMGERGENSTGCEVVTSPAVHKQSLSFISAFLLLVVLKSVLLLQRGFGGDCNHMEKSSE